MINYITQTGEEKDAEAFLRGLAQKVPQHEEELMTIAQQLEQKGLEKGILPGEQKGRLESKLEIAGRLLLSGMPRVSVKELTGLSEDELARI